LRRLAQQAGTFYQGNQKYRTFSNAKRVWLPGVFGRVKMAFVEKAKNVIETLLPKQEYRGTISLQPDSVRATYQKLKAEHYARKHVNGCKQQPKKFRNWKK
jgi:hypothetical protein